jgi:acyl-CoA synthetase (AMP-forming)/AMP-acid ligase II
MMNSHLSFWTRWKKQLKSADSEILSEAENLVAKIMALDLRQNELVALNSQDPYFFSAAYFSILDKKATPVIVNSWADLPAHLQSRYMVTESDIKSSESATNVSSFDHCFMTCSSGSTGTPKTFFHSIDSAQLNSKLHSDGLSITSDEVVIQTLPMSHLFGIIAYLWTPIVTGCKIIVSQKFVGLREFAQKRDQPCIIHLTPNQIDIINKDPYSYERCFEKMSVGAGILSRQNAEYLLENLTQNLYITYGLTEAGPRVTCERINLASFTDYSLGYPIPPIEVKIQKDNLLMGEGEGLLAIKTPCIAMNLTKNLNNGYFTTTDLVRLERSGRIIFCGRSEDIFKIRGKLVSRQTLEDQLLRISKIEEVFVVQVLNAGSEKLKIFLKTSETPEKITIQILREIPYLREGFEIICLTKMPRTSLGKIDRQNLLSNNGANGRDV